MSLFSKFELSHFSGILTMKVNGQWVPCVHNSFYSFMPIALKLYMYYGHGLKMCMWFGYNDELYMLKLIKFCSCFYNPRIIFCHIFHNLNLDIFSGIFSE